MFEIKLLTDNAVAHMPLNLLLMETLFFHFFTNVYAHVNKFLSYSKFFLFQRLSSEGYQEVDNFVNFIHESLQFVKSL